jgi:hypothetical protein
MVEQGTHKPLVPSSNLGVATSTKIRLLQFPAEEVYMQRMVTPVHWTFPPEWLTVEQACFLSGWDIDTMLEIAGKGGVDLNLDGLIDRESLHEFQEA